MKKIATLLFCAGALTACLEVPGPVVADYNGRIVKIQYHPYPLPSESYKASPIYAKAVETCRLDGRDDALYQGVTAVSQYAGHHTFLCV